MSSSTLSPPSGRSPVDDSPPPPPHDIQNARITQNNTTPTSAVSPDAGITGGIAKRIEDFKFIKPISRGTYGKVFLGYRKDKPDTLYAIKAIKKEDLVRKNMVNSVHIERKAFCLSAADPFCVRLFYSLQTTKTVYLVMEYMIGGDLKSLLGMMGFFNLRAAAFYTAEISLALEFIHKCGVVHRDVKPDNVLIDSRGHVKLTDFGLSRVSMESDLTPRRMNNFTPGQLMSLKTEFCFPATSPDSSKSFEYQKQPEQIRGNENSSASDIHTPLCSQSGSSLLILNRRFRKPLRKLKNVENKASLAMPIRGSNMKLTPEMPKFDMSEWSIIQTPTEKKTRLVDYGSFVNVTFESSPAPRPEPETNLPNEIFHHSSPIDPTSATTKVPLPILSPLLPLETPYSSDIYYYDASEHPHKRYKSGQQHTGEGLHMITPSTLDPSQISSAASDVISSSEPYASTASSMISPEFVRRDQTHIVNYLSTMDRHHHQVAPVKVPESNSKRDMASTSSSKKVNSGSMKRKRWISSGSRSRTGISITMRKLGLGSVNTPSGGSSTETAKLASSDKDNKSPPNGSGARIIGTPDYLAPEIIGKRVHGSAVDWWSLGICLYEFVVGCLPFSGESLNAIFHNIEMRDLEFPPDTDPSVQACIEAMLDLDPEKRPALARLRSAEFHGFFGDLPWDNMSSAEPPFIPNPSSPTDTGYFNPRNQEQNINVSEVINPQ